MMRPLKNVGKSLLCLVLERQVKRLHAKHDFQIVAVVGSVGKTSTKLAIAKVLGVKFKVVYQDGNYNDRLTVPLVLFGHEQPGMFNILAWIRILRSNSRQLKKAYPADVVVLELGTDGPGQIKHFKYLQPDIAVITAVAPEHMEYFKDLDAVAAEELTAVDFALKTLVNIDDVPEKYLTGKTFASYSIESEADFRLSDFQPHNLSPSDAKILFPDQTVVNVRLSTLGKQGAKISLAAAAVANMLGLDEVDVQVGVNAVTPAPGRMQVLQGKNLSNIIDDTYNASPSAVTAALDVLYATETSQRIAILGSMNELGEQSAGAHRAIGEYCNPEKLDLVVTIGQEANQYLAPAAEQKGCNVMKFDNPTQAGKFVADKLESGAVILVKGSQNGVFAEEAVVELLQTPEDVSKLVRQSSVWKAKKSASFSS